MYRKLAGVLASAVFVLPFMSGSASAATDIAKYQTTPYHDCRFTSWYDDQQPNQTSGVLTGVGDLRCAVDHQIEVDVYITDGIDDPAAVPGPPSALLGVGGNDGVGTTLFSSHTFVEGTVSQVVGQVPTPPLGHVYTVDTIAKFNDGCTALGCNPPPPAPPPAPPAPGTDASGSLNGQWGATCVAEHDGTFDVDCQWEFKVVGQAT